MKILLTGRTGQLGRALKPALQKNNELVAVGRSQLDLSDTDRIKTKIDRIRPDLIVNAAAYTNVDEAENEPELAFSVNAVAPELLAKWAADENRTIVHYSTDYIYDGCGVAPWREVDKPNPINIYGESKLAGERAIINSGAAYIILRTSWVYAARGRNFFLTMLRLAAENQHLTVIDDQFGAPTSSHFLADATVKILQNTMRGTSFALSDIRGVYNLVCSGETSWYGFAQEIFSGAQARNFPIKVKNLEAVSSEQYITKAKRPKNSRLCLDRLQRDFDIIPPTWQTALGEVLDEFITSEKVT